MELSTLEIFLGALAIAEAIALIILYLRKNKKSNVVCLKPGKDRLRVDYYWIDKEELKNANGNVEVILRNLRKTSERAEYIYKIEDTKKLVSKEKSVLVSLEIGAMEDIGRKKNLILKKEAVDDVAPPEDPTDETERMGAIKPPTSLGRPPGKAALMAIEILVEN